MDSEGRGLHSIFWQMQTASVSSGSRCGFIQWIEDPNTPIIEKGMSGLKKHYLDFMKMQSPLSELFLFDRQPMNEKSLRSHILSLMKQKNLVFKRPKTVDIDRLCI